MDFRHLVHYLVHGGEGKGHHARADDGPEATARRADARADVGFLGDGRGPQPLDAELGHQPGQRPQVAADVKHLVVPAHFLTERFHYRFGVGYLSHGLHPP